MLLCDRGDASIKQQQIQIEIQGTEANISLRKLTVQQQTLEQTEDTHTGMHDSNKNPVLVLRIYILGGRWLTRELYLR